MKQHKRLDPHSYGDLAEKYKSFGLSAGRGRLLLFAMAERIEAEEGPGPHPKPKNPIDCALYQFLKMCTTGEIAYIKELMDRLDGKAAQAINLGNHEGKALTLTVAQSDTNVL